MVVAINVTKDLPGLSVDVALTGLVVGQRYDMHRLQIRSVGTDPDTDAPLYEREIPDRPELWSSVAHRVGWEPTKTTATFRDYECPLRPHLYYVCLSSAIGPFEHDWDTGDYDVTRGTLDDEVVHFARDIAILEEDPGVGHVTVRSVHNLGQFVTLCVQDIPELRYVARGTELSVIGSRFPRFVTDIRESRRGSITFKVDTLGKYNLLQAILFPSTGRIRPVVFNSASVDPVMLLDDMRVIPLDISFEQITPQNADARYVHVDFIEIDGSAPLYKRTGDNDDLLTAPKAVMYISDTTPRVNQVITLSEASSTGQYDEWTWTFTPKPTNMPMGVSYAKGPHKVRWATRGKKTIKLRIGGSGAGAHSVTRTVQVG